MSIDEKDGSKKIAIIREGADRARLTGNFERNMRGGLSTVRFIAWPIVAGVEGKNWLMRLGLWCNAGAP